MSSPPLSPSSVQSVLHICELVTAIADNSSSKDTLSLARTCRSAFHALAPLLWENVKGIDQLFALLPNTTVLIYSAGGKKHDGSGSLTISFPPSFSDEGLERFRFYSPFVKQMELYNETLYKDYTYQNWSSIRLLSKTTQLLPSLRSLILTQSAWIRNQFFYQSQLPWIIPLISPSLSSLTIRITNVQNTPVCSLAGAACLLRRLGSTCPGLKTLDVLPTQSLQPFYQDQMFLSELGEENIELDWFRYLKVLGNLQCLRITVPASQQQGIELLGNLSQLERLELTLLPEHFDQEQPELTLSKHAFPCLRHLSLYRLPDLKFFRVLWKLSSMVAELESLQVHFDKYRWSDLMGYDKLSNMVSIICEASPDISDLAIYPPYEGSGSESSEIIYHLLSQLPLRRLCFAPVTPTVLNLGYRMATYPLLQVLELSTSWTELSDLAPLAQNLPNLNYFVLNLTATLQQWEERRSDDTMHHMQPIAIRVTDVFFGDDWDEESWNEREIENFFLSLWPNARFLKQNR